MNNSDATCTTCMHSCSIPPGKTGKCKARTNRNGIIECSNYGIISALALDPIEKKPLRLFYPGTMILSVGSYGCNLSCPFCQNWEISQQDQATIFTKKVTPAELTKKAEELRYRGNIGIAYTYNEPLIGWEFVRDTEILVHEADMKNVVVTNGYAEPQVLNEILPFTDAMNIDLKGFTASWYKMLGGNLSVVKQSIEHCAEKTHIELTTLIVPGYNDRPEEMDELAAWIASIDKTIPLHITRFFPQYKMEKALPTDIKTIYLLKETADHYLTNVFTGNC